MMSEEVISWSTKLVAAKAIVMFCTSHTDLVLEVSNSCIVFQSLPLAAWIDHARVGCLLDNAIRIWKAEEMSELMLHLGIITSHITALQLLRQDLEAAS